MTAWIGTRQVPYPYPRAYSPGSWYSGLLALAVTAAVTAAAIALVMYAGRKLETRQLIRETEQHLRRQEEEVI